jgi:hypothetical protein
MTPFENTIIALFLSALLGGAVAIWKNFMNVDTRLSVLESQTESLKEIQSSLAEISTTQTEMRVMLVGSTGNNGMNSVIKALNTDVKELREQFVKLITRFEMSKE